jgi:hypothetical protein
MKECKYMEENNFAQKNQHQGAEPKIRRPPHRNKLNAAATLVDATINNTDSSNLAHIRGPKGGDIGRSSSLSKSDIPFKF